MKVLRQPAMLMVSREHGHGIQTKGMALPVERTAGVAAIRDNLVGVVDAILPESGSVESIRLLRASIIPSLFQRRVPRYVIVIIDRLSRMPTRPGDLEMHQTKKGNHWYFGMKRHFGVDSRSA